MLNRGAIWTLPKEDVKTISSENQVKDMKKISKTEPCFRVKREKCCIFAPATPTQCSSVLPNTNYFYQFQGMESFSKKFVGPIPTKNRLGNS